ncbi:GMF family protein [Aspergillus aculeatinus CBS 121060]|uniref:Glia maturation factor beta n=1 Tax=Aspergillus aculeatinus CBS 121060 TaxID=1448322 RepID=A0ACD1H3J1_9EURO|nr:glia maturation factor beta [Aspergillus aculeatinus CBS 121060]RAH68034.1 glia maturation factor beta [Aspergillus aculeatinus CBS 121060]
MSESRLYSFSPETKEKLRKFRLGTSRAKDPQAVIYIIDNKSQEIRPEDGEVYTKMEDLADELPETSPRFILLSYPLTLSSGRLTVPYVMLYYLPENCNPSLRMMYAGAVELMRNTAEVNRVIEVESEDDIVGIEARLQSQN